MEFPLCLIPILQDVYDVRFYQGYELLVDFQHEKTNVHRSLYDENEKYLPIAIGNK